MNNTTSIVKLSDIIEYDIIQLLLEYLLCGDKDETRNVFKRPKYFKNKNEIIKLSTVCKRWFNRISNVITNNIIEESLKQYGSGEWSFIDNDDDDDARELNVVPMYNSNNNNNNSKWSLIKVDQSIINEFHESIFESYSYEPNSNDYINKKQVVLNLYGTDQENDIVLFNKLFNNRKSLPPSVFRIINNSSFNINQPHQIVLLSGSGESSVVPLTFHTLCIENIDLSFGELFEMGLLKTRNLILEFTNKESIENNKQLFSKICCDSNSNDQLKSIHIINPFDFGSIKYLNNMVNLESLSFSIYFLDLCRNLTLFNRVASNKNKADWESMIESLSNNKYIKRLTIHGVTSWKQQEFNGIEIISNGIKQLFQSNKSIKYLKFYNFNILLPSVWSGLISNQTLKTLKLYYYYENTTNLNLAMDYLFSKLFNMDTHGGDGNNQSLIRHFYLESNEIENNKIITTLILQLLYKYPNSSLYSITFAFYLKDHFNLLIDLLSLPNLTINQFNLKVNKNDFNINEFYKLPQIKNLKNNKIINLTYLF